MTWHKQLDEAAKILNLTIQSYWESLNQKDMPRYFHADCSATDSTESLWRLKVVNTGHQDVNGIKNCLSYNNIVHSNLVTSPTLTSIVRIPAFFSIPNQYLSLYSCSELLELHKPGIENIPIMVQKLLDLQSQRLAIRGELPPTIFFGGVYIYNRSQYRQRTLVDSGQSLVGKHLLSGDELTYVAAKFDKWYSVDLPDDNLTIVHGDFAFGNLTLLNGQELGLIDFEHTHIGSGLTDLAHLYVNLQADGDEENAQTLLNTYQEEAGRRKIDFDTSIFKALVLERAAGKLNSMTDTAGEKAARLKGLLLA